MKQQLEVKRGDTLPFEIAITYEGGAPFDLTGWAVALIAKKKYTDLDADAVINQAATIVDAPAGLCRVVVLPAATKALPNVETWLVFDVQLTKNNDRYTPIFGDMKILREAALA